MEKVNIFVCSNCSKQKNSSDFPYSSGWKYLKDIKWKESNELAKYCNDKHFCSSKCFVVFLSKNITMDGMTENEIIEK